MNCRDCQATIVPSVRDWPHQLTPGWWIVAEKCEECGYCTAYHAPLTARRVEHADRELLYRWRTDPATIAGSFQPPPTPAEHCAWFYAALARLECPVILTLGRLPVGTLTVAPRVGITIAPEYRGLGLATYALAHYPFPAGVCAHVKVENNSSCLAFLNAGWKPVEVIFCQPEKEGTSL